MSANASLIGSHNPLRILFLQPKSKSAAAASQCAIEGRIGAEQSLRKILARCQAADIPRFCFAMPLGSRNRAFLDGDVSAAARLFPLASLSACNQHVSFKLSWSWIPMAYHSWAILDTVKPSAQISALKICLCGLYRRWDTWKSLLLHLITWKVSRLQQKMDYATRPAFCANGLQILHYLVVIVYLAGRRRGKTVWRTLRCWLACKSALLDIPSS